MMPRVIELNELIEGMNVLLRSTFGERVAFEIRLDSTLGRIRADPSQLEQVLLNLAINARDAISGSGTVVVETANVYLDQEYAQQNPNIQPGHYVMLAVSDDGTGMSTEVKEHIFEPFFTTKNSGTGLGLSTVQGIVAQSGGTMAIQSELGAGSTFKIYLPRVEEPSDTWVEETNLDRDVFGSESILVVDDEELLLNLVSETLTLYGYNVQVAEDGAAALRAADISPPDLLLTDIILPGPNGREVAEQVLLQHPQTRVLYMSGYTPSHIDHFGELDPAKLLQKPFTTRDLLGAIRAELDKSTVLSVT